MVDVLRARVPAVIVPFEAGSEKEQRWRAERLAARGLAAVVTESELSPQTLFAAVSDRLAARDIAPREVPALDGIARSTSIVAAEASAARRRAALRARIVAGLDRLAASGRRFPFWWRDDDAVEPTPALDRLLALSEATRVPVALAVIPASVRESLAEAIEPRRGVSVLQHGWSHENHAPPGAKKAELAAPDPGARRDELARGRDRLSGLFGDRFIPVLVPPWNRIASELVPVLPGLGYLALSTYARDDRASAVPGLAQLNTHLDPVDWHGGRGLADEGELLATLAQAVEERPREPFGILTHHLVHDPWTWRFIGDVLNLL
ncbi:glycosyltransferase, partial [Nostoc sp. NIES-2111]